ncbi:MAG: DUF4291 family protein [Candidatus Micrarchaeota archaeon]|nr:DUF4291 family protein [Candidatus Micrarchaeota archaeon]
MDKTISHAKDLPVGPRKEIDTEPEYLFRRCSRAESEAALKSQKLPDGHAPIHKGNGRDSSDRNKWVSRNPRFIIRYNPRRADCEMYRDVLVIEVKPGTLRQLEEMKGRGEVKDGPKGAYGLPPALIESFNGQIISITAHENGNEVKRRLSPLNADFPILVKSNGEPCFFVSFPCNMLTFQKDNVFFGDDVNLDRTTWLKTSVMWATWRSDFATKEGMDRLLQIPMPLAYLNYLSSSAVSTKENKRQDEIVYQRDPDRAPVHSADPRHVLPFQFDKAGSTVHFGLRGNALLEFVTDLSKGRITDITNTMQDFFFHCKLSGEGIARGLYDRLKLSKATYAETVLKTFK